MKSHCASVYGNEALRFARQVELEKPRMYEGTAKACRVYYDFLRDLDFHLTTAFKCVVQNLKKMDSLEQARQCWLAMAKLCNDVLGILSDVRQNRPDCGQAEDFDFILDLRKESSERASFLNSSE